MLYQLMGREINTQQSELNELVREINETPSAFTFEQGIEEEKLKKLEALRQEFINGGVKNLKEY